jgi:hypothetical protein
VLNGASWSFDRSQEETDADTPSAFETAVAQEKASEALSKYNGSISEDASCDIFSIHHFYFKFKGRTYCLDLPALTCSSAAA